MGKVSLKQIIAMALTGVMLVLQAPAALSEGNPEKEGDNEPKIGLQFQHDVCNRITEEVFEKEVLEAHTVLSKQFKEEELMRLLECAYYVINRNDINTYEFGIKGSYVHENDGENATDAYALVETISRKFQKTGREIGKVAALRKLNYGAYDKALLNKYLSKAIANSGDYNIIDAICDYNAEVGEDSEKAITGDACYQYGDTLVPYLTKVVNGECDLPTALNEYHGDLCASLDIRSLYHRNSDKNLSAASTAAYIEACETGNTDKLFTMITSQCFDGTISNHNEGSLGFQWSAGYIWGNCYEQLLRDDMRYNKNANGELYKHFDQKALEGSQQWIYIGGNETLDLSNPLEAEVSNYNLVAYMIYDKSGNDIMHNLEVCNATDFAGYCDGNNNADYEEPKGEITESGYRMA